MSRGRVWSPCRRRPTSGGDPATQVSPSAVSVLAITTVAAWTGDPTAVELELFRFVDGWPEWIETPFWIAMQAGSAAAVLLVAAAAWAIWRKDRLAVGLFAAGALAWLLAKLIKETVERGRPRVFVDDVIERPEWEGLGFVSGHAAVKFAIATVVSPYPRGGAALGVALGGAANLVVGGPAGHRSPTEPVGAPGRSP